MAWARKMPNGKWKGQYRDPERKVCSRVFDLKKDALTWAQEKEGSIRKGVYVDPKRGERPLGDYFAERVLSDPRLAPTTLDLYERLYRNHIAPTFARRQLASIAPTDVQTWVDKMLSAGVGDATVAASKRLLSTTLMRAVKEEILTRNPARYVRVPAVGGAGGLRVLEAEEVRGLAEQTPERYRTLVYVLAYRGLRVGEAIGLRVGDLDLMRGQMHIRRKLVEVNGRLIEGDPKTDAGRRDVSLPAFLRDMLVEHVAAYSSPADLDALVFPSEEGGPIRLGNFRKRVVTKAKKRAGINPKLTIHDLRDTAATLAFAAGASVKEVSVMLGHKDPAMTLRRYTGVLESMRQATDDALDVAFRAAMEAEPASVASVVELQRLLGS